jgi:hypothetical protein
MNKQASFLDEVFGIGFIIFFSFRKRKSNHFIYHSFGLFYFIKERKRNDTKKNYLLNKERQLHSEILFATSELSKH